MMFAAVVSAHLTSAGVPAAGQFGEIVNLGEALGALTVVNLYGTVSFPNFAPWYALAVGIAWFVWVLDTIYRPTN